MNNLNWRIGNPITLRMVAPIDMLDPSTPAVVDDSGRTCQAYLYDARAMTELSVAYASGAVVTVEDTDGFADADTCGMRLAGAIGSTAGDAAPEPLLTIDTAGVDATAKTLTFTGDPPRAMPIGTRVAKRIDDGTVTGLIYGTPLVTDKEDWGWIVTFPALTAGIVVGGFYFAEMLVYEDVGLAVLAAEQWELHVTDPHGRP